MTVFRASSPAKLIISGEHAVVYGAPAIAMAVNKYAVTTVSWEQKKVKHPRINFNLLDLKYASSYTLNTLWHLQQQLRENYGKFLQGYCSIKEVIKKPFELLQYVVTNLIEILQLTISDNLNIKVNSSIPIGAGLGSSAAAIISCLRSLAHLFKITWDPKKFLQIAVEIENLQHGRSSGIDLYTTLFGGCNYFAANTKNAVNLLLNTLNDPNSKLNLPDVGFKLVHTGNPMVTTGECVAQAKAYFMQEQTLIEKFTEVTLMIKNALISNDPALLKQAIKENHALLCYIKVVPAKVKQFIAELEAVGGAGKICGAGSIYGDAAGTVLLLGQEHSIVKLAAKYKYKVQDFLVDAHGVRIV